MVKPKARRKKKTDMEVAQGILLGYVNLLDVVFTRATGKRMKDWLEEFRRQPGQLPPGAPSIETEPEMSYDNACMVLGVKRDAPMEKVDHNFRALAMVYHSDRGAMNDEVMKILNRAYARIKKEKGK